MDTKTARSTFSILYYINKTRNNKQGECPIYVRLSVNSTQTAMSIQRSILLKNWSVETGQPIGNNSAVNEIRQHILAMNANLYNCHKQLCEGNEPLTAQLIRDAFMGKSNKPVLLSKTLYAIFDEFLNKQEALVGIDVTQITVNRYKLLKKTVFEFLQVRYNRGNDFPIEELTKGFILDFVHYMKTDVKSGHNNTMKYLQRLKKFAYYCLNHKYLTEDPCFGVKTTLKETKRDYLTEDELVKIMNKDFGMERLNVVRDIFVFCCFTGLSYIDAKNLKRTNIELTADKKYWIRIHRQKTDEASAIQLLEIPLEIIKKYVNLDLLKPSDTVLPISSNQKINAYLKEIGVLCGIDKNITVHVARHTFATTVTLRNGVPLETLQMMLGHKSIETTQHYARMVNLKVGEDMTQLGKVFKKRKAFGGLR